MTDYMQAVCRNVKARREDLNLTQEQVARRAGVARASIANLEAGRQNPPLDTLAAIAVALRTTVAQLLPPEPVVTCPAGAECPFDPMNDGAERGNHDG